MFKIFLVSLLFTANVFANAPVAGEVCNFKIGKDKVKDKVVLTLKFDQANNCYGMDVEADGQSQSFPCSAIHSRTFSNAEIMDKRNDLKWMLKEVKINPKKVDKYTKHNLYFSGSGQSLNFIQTWSRGKYQTAGIFTYFAGARGSKCE